MSRRPNFASKVLPILEQMRTSSRALSLFDSDVKDDRESPTYFICPISQDVGRPESKFRPPKCPSYSLAIMPRAGDIFGRTCLDKCSIHLYVPTGHYERSTFCSRQSYI